MKEYDYSDDDMYREVEGFINKLGGTIKCINPASYLFSIDVEEHLQEFANEGVARIAEKYRVGRAKYLLNNPLERINMIRKDFVVKEIK